MKKILWALGLLMLCTGSGQAKNTILNIPAQDLPSALQSLSNQTGIQLLFAAEQMQNVRVLELNGTMKAEEVLARLLKDTPHTFESSGENTCVVKTAAAEKEMMMPEVKVTGFMDPDGSFSSEFD